MKKNTFHSWIYIFNEELKASLQKLETLIPYVKLWLREEFEFELVEESADGSLHDQVQQDDDEEVEDDESVHLLAELRLWAHEVVLCPEGAATIEGMTHERRTIR